MKHVLLVLISISLCLPVFSCDICVSTLAKKQKEIDGYIKNFIEKHDQCDSFIAEQYYYLLGHQQALLEARMAIESIHSCKKKSK